MSWLGEAFSNLWRPKKFGSSWFYSAGIDTDVWGWDKDKCLDSFNDIPELNAVINLKARSFANGVIKCVDKNGEEIENGVPECIKTPNWFQGQREFLRQTKLFRDIYGDEYIYQFFGVGMKELTGVKALFTLPPNLVECEYLAKQPFFAYPKAPPEIKYFLTETEEELPTEQIIHLNDNRVTVKSATGKNILKGESKMRGLAAAINNIRYAYEARGVILKTRGAVGLLANNATDVAGQVQLDPKERERVQKEFLGYGTLKGQHHTIITDMNLRWQKMGVNPSELGLYQETEQDFFKICDSYGVPIDLFSTVKGATFENQKQAEKGFYVRTIIPEANEWIGALSKALLTDGNSLVMDFSHLSIFAEDLKLRGESLTAITNALSKMLVDGVITTDEYKEELLKYGIGKTNT